jgi:hypothetical protein
MRLLNAVLLLSLCGVPALAQTVVPPTAAHQGRRSAAEHFADANTTHDGRLTLDQATVGYKSIAKSFSQIDVAHHGYVTLDDIKAWKAAKKAARVAAKHAAADAADGVLRPGQVPPTWMGLTPLRTSTDTIVPAPTEQRRIGVDLPTAPVDGRSPS